MANTVEQQRALAIAQAKRKRAEAESQRELEGAPRSFMDEAKRQAGLTVRAGANAIAGIPLLVGDAANAAINLPLRASNRFLGTDVPLLPSASGSFDQSMTEFGLPQPETTAEKLAGVGMSAIGGAGVAKAAANALKSAPGMIANRFMSESLTGAPKLGPVAELNKRASPYVSSMVDELANAPVMQGVGAMGGAGTQSGMQAIGVENPALLGAAGIIGSGGTALGATGAQRLGGATSQLIQPLKETGRDIIVGKTLNKMATDPHGSIANLADAPRIVPGSAPTVSQASRDPGLAGAENAIRGFDETNRIGQRIADQNKARQDHMRLVAGDETTLQTAQMAKSRAYDEGVTPAFADKTPVKVGREWSTNPVMRTIRAIKESPKGARASVQNALKYAEERLTQEGVDITDVEVLYEIRRDLRLARDGKLSGRSGKGVVLDNLNDAKYELDKVMRSLDEIIETGAPGYKDYLKDYAEKSTTENQIRAAQTLRQRMENTTPDPIHGENIFAGSARKKLEANLDRGLNLRGKGPDAGNLTDEQIRVIQDVTDDIDRAAASQASTVRAPGSETFKNMSVASVLGRFLGDGAEVGGGGASIARPFTFLYRVSDEQIRTLLIDAWLDPKLAAMLMQKANKNTIESVAKVVAERLRASEIANAIYGE